MFRALNSMASVFCGSWPDAVQPFTLGVAQSLSINLEVELAPSTYGGMASASLGGSPLLGPIPQFVFWDVNGRPLSNITYSLVEEVALPESAAPMESGLILLALLLRGVWRSGRIES